MKTLRKSRANNTVKKYDCYFQKFKQWCRTTGQNDLPASPETLCTFIMHNRRQNSSWSVMSAYNYAIHWYHDIHCPDSNNPTYHKTVSYLMDAFKRIQSKPRKWKDVITPEHLSCMAYTIGGFRAGLLQLRNFTMFLVAYSGFLRFDELASLKAHDIFFFDTYMKIFIEKSKCDQYREGSSVVIAKSNSLLCPVTYMKTYMKRSNIQSDSNEFLFRAVTFFKSKGHYEIRSKNVMLSYTTVREHLLNFVEKIGLERKNFGTHSLRAGGATTAANRGIPDRLFKRHGRWKSEKAKDMYVKDCLQSLLSVSKTLGL